MACQYFSSLEIEPENENKATVAALYKAMASGEMGKVAGLLASDLEYWFHGPQSSNHMMKMLTGEAPHSDFKFELRSITAIEDRVIVEGYEGANVYWVHVWNLKGGLITQFREYFNTWLTITEFKKRGVGTVGWFGLTLAQPCGRASHETYLGLVAGAHARNLIIADVGLDFYFPFSFFPHLLVWVNGTT